MSKLKKAALTMLADRGWLCIPLGLDANGLPKRPLSAAWTSLDPTEEVVQGLPWDQAKGLGIVLGEKSRNLGVLDIDDKGLFGVLRTALGVPSEAPRLVSTARDRGHWYCYTLNPSPSTVREVLWNGNTIKIELKAGGTQVAAPPTTGYSLLNRNDPQLFDTMDEAFEFFCDVLLDFAPTQFAMPQQQLGMGAGYPKPWADEVQANNRNQTSYIEAHKLREAGIPLEQALTLMQASYEQRYEKGGIDWYEIQSTIKSAYRKGMPRQKPDHFGGVEI
jgi:hypothetical protein